MSAEEPSAPASNQRNLIEADAVLAQAVEVAIEALAEIAPAEEIGEHLAAEAEEERVVTHTFVCLNPGYVGWRWSVTLARAPRTRKATVCEIELLPGPDALLAEPWIPWAERLRPGDLGRQDTLPYQADDVRLDQGYEQVGEDADVQLIEELGLGRVRVLSAVGRDRAMKRWYASEQGRPAERNPNRESCASCGFLMKMAGSARQLFGVCANEWSPDDGRAVSLDHYCGAHSETDDDAKGQQWPIVPSYVDETSYIEIDPNS